MIINKNTAGRVKNFCKAIELGYEKQLPESPYTYSELGRGTVDEKVQRWTEVKFATNKDTPSRSEVRQYNKLVNTLGHTHEQRMASIWDLKLRVYNEAVGEYYVG